MAMSPTTLTIAGPQNDDIVGILEQKTSNPLPGTKIIVLLHGHAYDLLPFAGIVLCTWLIGCGSGHKNYCYHRQLAEKAPFDSFRFDFRGNGDSGRCIHAVRTLKVCQLWKIDVC
jgi:pimeloyl-ACP methyl ester carboxylesterase